MGRVIGSCGALIALALVLFLLRADPAEEAAPPRRPCAPTEVAPASTLEAAVTTAPGPLTPVVPTPVAVVARPTAASNTPRPRHESSERDTDDELVRPRLLFKGPHGPVPGALVNARTRERRFRPRRTPPDGEVELEALHPAEGPVLLTVRDARFGRQTFDAEVRARQQVFKLERPATGLLEGRIVTTQQVPVSNPVLTVVDREGVATELDDLAPDPSGRFSVELVPGNYTVTARAPRFCSSEPVEVTIQRLVPSPVEIVLARAAGIAGRFLQPPAGRLQVELVPLDGSTTEVRPLRVAKDGSYEIKDLRPGSFRVRACDEDHDGLPSVFQLFEGHVADGPSLVLISKERDLYIAGDVLDSNGEPVPTAEVTVSGRRVVLDDAARFGLRIEPMNTYDIEVAACGYRPRHTIVTRPAADRLSGVRIELEPLD